MIREVATTTAAQEAVNELLGKAGEVAQPPAGWEREQGQGDTLSLLPVAGPATPVYPRLRHLATTDVVLSTAFGDRGQASKHVP
ncbi:unnamed protein product [Clavelina lepadiformis]|uniref:Uncharacterized protein n=1 Tax=Clavelina lepadiformis TaxID=159417 RepID=A0ABP0EW51_CLALP